MRQHDTQCLVDEQVVSAPVVPYDHDMTRRWTDTVENHRRDVRSSILDATVQLVGQHGLRGVTMSEIADEAGIGRATLYKYFSSVEAILEAWHEQQVTGHLELIAEAADQAGTSLERLHAVLSTYARVGFGGHDHQLGAALHRTGRPDHATTELARTLERLIAAAAEDGDVRTDVPPAELTRYCLNALEAAAHAGSDGARRRLIGVVLDGMR
jgi:AcrR family transcriptional regulator